MTGASCAAGRRTGGGALAPRGGDPTVGGRRRALDRRWRRHGRRAVDSRDRRARRDVAHGGLDRRVTVRGEGRRCPGRDADLPRCSAERVPGHRGDRRARDREGERPGTRRRDRVARHPHHAVEAPRLRARPGLHGDGGPDGARRAGLRGDAQRAREILDHRARALEAALGRERRGPPEPRVERLGQRHARARRALAGGLRGAGGDRHQERVDALALGALLRPVRLPDEERVGDLAERVEIRLLADRALALHLLGRHVERRPERARRLRLRGARDDLRDPEVEHLHARRAVVPCRQEQVLRLEIAVDDALIVRAVERERHLPEQDHDLLRGEPPLPRDAGREILAVKESITR